MALLNSILVQPLFRYQIPFVTDTSDLDEESFSCEEGGQEELLVKAFVDALYARMEGFYFLSKTESAREGVSSRMETRVRKFVEKGNVAEARRLISEVPAGFSRKLDKWRRLLADPVVQRQGAASGKNFKTDFRWIQQNSGQYKGQWVAIKNGQFLGNNESRLALHRELKQSGKLDGATFLKVEE